MMKARASIIAFVLVTLATPMAHAGVAEDARGFKNGVKSAGKQAGHAVRDGAHAIGRGAKAAGHAIADTTKQGYRATKKAVRGHE
ncbi:conserved exported hypothetical protein [Cupriavidus necator]|uniref:Uncharacterized protein n=2 Tax=Cupriavidus necator TaxID=106590 RepID=A0A1K0IRE4_CUPNE|nr:conserved exported hypothetical protein [Cupriavidus necator]